MNVEWVGGYIWFLNVYLVETGENKKFGQYNGQSSWIDGSIV